MAHEAIWWFLRAGWVFPALAESCCHCPLPLARAHHPAVLAQSRQQICPWGADTVSEVYASETAAVWVWFFFFFFSHCDFHVLPWYLLPSALETALQCISLLLFGSIFRDISRAACPSPSTPSLLCTPAPSHTPLAALLLGPAGIPRYREKIYNKEKSRSSSWINTSLSTLIWQP